MQHDNSSLPGASLQKIRTLLHDGRMADAEQSCVSLLKKYSDHSELQYLAGLTFLLQAQADSALKHLKLAAEKLPHRADVMANLGEAWRQAGEIEQSITSNQRALQLSPNYPTAHHNLGCSLFLKEDFKAALDAFSKAIEHSPDNEIYLSHQGDAHRELGHFSKAITCYRKALDINQNCVSALCNLGPLLAANGDFEEAEQIGIRAVTRAPKSWEAHLNHGRTLSKMERLDEAMDFFAEAYELNPSSANLCVIIGKTWTEVEDQPQASYWFQKGLELDSDCLEAMTGLARVLLQTGMPDIAITELEALSTQYPDSLDVHRTLSDAYWDNGDSQDALKSINEAIKLSPEMASLYPKRGQIHASIGLVDAAIEDFHLALSQNKNSVSGYCGLATAIKGKLDPKTVEQMHTLSENPLLREGAQGLLLNGLAHYYDGCSDYEKAADLASRANALQWVHKQRRGWTYSTTDYESDINDHMATFNADFFHQHRHWGNTDITPVFIVGMPRSGTTLTEQILANHPNILGIGERDFANRAFRQLAGLTATETKPIRGPNLATEEQVDKVASDYLQLLRHLKLKMGKSNAVHVVDKMPDNYSLLGLITLLFPSAKIIHCRRNPKDVTVSCWLTQFGRIRWACNTEHLAQRIRQYQRMMEHWKTVLPTPMLEIDYEDTVANPEAAARKMLSFIGQPWDPSCLRFQQGDTIVRTASVTQVRQPIHKRSVERWRDYSPYLDELFGELD